MVNEEKMNFPVVQTKQSKIETSKRVKFLVLCIFSDRHRSWK